MNHAAQGAEFYFPPLRAGLQPLALAAFGILCIVLPALAFLALVPAGADARGLMSIVLVGIFIAPFPAFGAAFIVLAVYVLANSLTVRVDPAAISTVRRVFGIVLSRRRLEREQIAAIEAQPAPRYHNPLGGRRLCLVARHHVQRKFDLVVADNLDGEDAAARMRSELERHAGLKTHAN
jgi:hypothetical protein